MREKFRNSKLEGTIKINLAEKGIWSADKREILAQIVEICDDYRRQGYVLTLRQLYYQLVAKEAIPNHDAVYKKLSGLKDEVVYNGSVDWNMFEDRGRVPSVPYFDESIAEALDYAARTFRLEKQKGQKVHIEVWTEKDAISAILKKITNKLGATLVVNKGYTSSTAIYGAYARFMDRIEQGQRVEILYFGDHDPSGLDMVRDINDRLKFMFINGERREFDELEAAFNLWANAFDEDGEETYTAECWMYAEHPDCRKGDPKGEYTYFCPELAFYKHHIKITPIGLTMDQIREYNPPPNPAKITDPRAKAYIKTFGQVSWEVDALRPAVMEAIVEGAILARMDAEVYAEVLEKEAADKAKIKEIVRNLRN